MAQSNCRILFFISALLFGFGTLKLKQENANEKKMHLMESEGRKYLYKECLYFEVSQKSEAVKMKRAGTYSGILSGGISGRGGPPHLLPLARIKKIMKKSSVDVKMISGEAPIVLSKACELFIEEITKRAWNITLQGKRRTLCKEDVASAVIATDVFDFLVSLVQDSAN